LQAHSEVPMRLLVVEDQRQMARYLSRALAEESFAVDLAHDGVAALELVETYDYDAIVLDVMLPRMDGLAVCQRLRSSGRDMPIIIVSARDMVEDRVRGLDAGADDYLVKPFALEELAARLRALARRPSKRETTVLRAGELELDPAKRTVRSAGRAVTLTAKEYAILEYLMRRPGLVLTRAMIAEHVWDYSFDQASNVVDVHVKHIRDKIDVAGRPSFIQAVRGVGYVLGDPGAPPS
jgi:two-component system OmpR family response regulator